MIGVFFQYLQDEVIPWCRGKNFLLRLPLLAWFGYVLFRHLLNPDYASILAAANLGVHELGHLVMGFFGMFIGITGGTLFELLAPFALMVNFWKQKDFFAITLCFGWLSTALFGVARYIGDARSMSLPLVSPFGGGGGVTYHDWNYLLDALGLLQFDGQIASVVRTAAVCSMAVCLLSGGWLLRQMSLNNPE